MCCSNTPYLRVQNDLIQCPYAKKRRPSIKVVFLLTESVLEVTDRDFSAWAINPRGKRGSATNSVDRENEVRKIFTVLFEYK